MKVFTLPTLSNGFSAWPPYFPEADIEAIAVEENKHSVHFQKASNKWMEIKQEQYSFYNNARCKAYEADLMNCLI